MHSAQNSSSSTNTASPDAGKNKNAVAPVPTITTPYMAMKACMDAAHAAKTAAAINESAKALGKTVKVKI